MKFNEELNYVNKYFIVSSVKESFEIAKEHQQFTGTELEFGINMVKKDHQLRKTTDLFHQVVDTLK